ncbi:MAG: Crp/Fnr family transcriptional regulator [Deltaproteobacteria bacterium]|nr:MAG: Crp/Fnr family transcriptional regulator [Deltaproteobacteria bacterium]
MGRYRELLQNVTIFSELDERGLDDLERLLIPRTYAKDAIIVGHEEEGDSLYIISKGKAKAGLLGESGREVILYVFKPGDFFGEMSLLDDEPRSANVQAVEETEVLVLKRDSFHRHIREYPQTALSILKEMSRRLRRADGIIGSLALLDVYGRVARMLRELADRDGIETEEGILIRERPTQQDIAAMIGTSRETVSRALNDFAKRGFVEMSGRSILLRHNFLRSGEISRSNV